MGIALPSGHIGSTIAYNVNVAFFYPQNYFPPELELVYELEKRTMPIVLSSHLFSRDTITLFTML